MYFLAVVHFTCWVVSSGDCQRFGSTSTGRYRTDFNGLSLERLGQERGPGIIADKVYGIVQASTEFVYHSLALLESPGQSEQYGFWQSIFGPALHGRLYYFSVGKRIALQHRPEIPIGNFLRLKTFFVNLEDSASACLLSQLQEEGSCEPWAQDSKRVLCVRIPVAFAELIFADIRDRWSYFALPDPALDQLFHGAQRERSRIMGWKHCPFSATDFVQPPFPAAAVDGEAFTHATAEFAADTIRHCFASLQSGSLQCEDLLESCHRAAHCLQSFVDELDPANAQASCLAIRGRVSAGYRIRPCIS